MSESEHLAEDKVQDLLGEFGHAPWASKDETYSASGEEDERRSQYKHDVDEITYSASLRRLSHKSQIVVKPEHSDLFRSRLTHTLEVNQIAESIGLRLGLNRSLINAIALGHDIGHSPFGHAGEREFQQIIMQDVLGDCDVDQLRQLLAAHYQCNDLNLATAESRSESAHWLFHHAINSVRLTQRKMKNITLDTADGIRTHSWSPWKSNPKFGIPSTYEAQAVAIADQVAGINHDTEDILDCEESEHNDPEIIRREVPSHARNSDVTYQQAREELDSWFLPGGRKSNRIKSWGRKWRLRRIINSVVNASAERLIELGIDDPKKASEPNCTLTIEDNVGKFLDVYENYVREDIIKTVSWFRHRDATAAGVVKTVCNFYKHYARARQSPKGFPPKWLDRYRDSISDDEYYKDKHFGIFRAAAKPGREKSVEDSLQVVDYVSGMTDRWIMEVHEKAFRMFE